MTGQGAAIRGPRLARGEVWMLAMVVVVCRVLAVNAFAIYDDAFITYRYAVNLADGHGLVFNPGAPWEPVLGTTTPGYAMLLAGMSAVGLDVVVSSLAINFLADAVSALLLMRLLDYRLFSSTVAVLAFACIPEIARISAGGMEPPVVVALALGAVALLQAGRPMASGLAAALCCTFRPEAVLLVGVLSVWQWKRPRELARFLLPVAIIGAIVMGALQWFYGSPISQSVQAKAAASGEKLPWYRVSVILSQAFGPSVPMRLMFVLVIFGALRSLLTRSRLLPFAIFAGAIVASYLAFRPKTWGWYYYAPLLTWAAWFGLGIEQVAEWIGTARLAFLKREGVRPILCAAAGCGVAAVAAWSYLHPDRVTPMIYHRFENWARAERLEERGSTLFASDIGAIGYYSRARVLDSNGLVWPKAIGYRDRGPEAQWQAEMIRDHRPDYVVLVVKRHRLEFFRNDEALRALYRPIRRFNRFNVTGLEKLEPDAKSLPDWWEQDYIVYELKPQVIGDGAQQ